MFYINRLEKDIKYKVSLILLKFINDIRLKNITIIDVKLCKDFSFAKIYVLFSDEDNIFNKIKILNNSSKYISKKLFNNMNIRKIPKILFLYDNYIKNIFNVINLIDNSIKNS